MSAYLHGNIVILFCEQMHRKANRTLSHDMLEQWKCTSPRKIWIHQT